MKKVIGAVMVAVILVGAINTVYAYQPDRGQRATISLRENIANNVNLGNRNGAKKVFKLYLYEQSVIDSASEDSRADYTAWGQLIYNSNNETVLVGVHGLESDQIYTLQYDNQEVATGTANDEGNLTLRAPLVVEAWDAREGQFSVVSEDGMTTLVESATKIKPLSDSEMK